MLRVRAQFTFFFLSSIQFHLWYLFHFNFGSSHLRGCCAAVYFTHTRYDRHIALVPRFRGQEKLPSHLRPASSSSTLLAEASAADSAPVNTAKKDDSSRNNDCSSNSSSGNGFNTTRDPLWLMGTSAPSNYDRRTPFPLPQTWTHYLAPVSEK